MDELGEHWRLVHERNAQRNQRLVKKGKKPVHATGVKTKTKALPKPESGDIDDTAMSYDEWSSCGYIIKKGERSQISDPLGVPQFTANQVRKLNPAWKSWRTHKKS